MTGKEETAQFLQEFKNIVAERGLDIIPRTETIDFLTELRITKKDCKNIIMELSVLDYCAGPEPDKDKPGDVWMFGKEIGAKQVYIKLKSADVGNRKIAKCLSFHTAKYPLSFPHQA